MILRATQLREGGDAKKHEANVIRRQIEASILADLDRIAKEHSNLVRGYHACGPVSTHQSQVLTSSNWLPPPAGLQLPQAAALH